MTGTIIESIGLSVSVFDHVIDLLTPLYTPRGRLLDSQFALKLSGLSFEKGAIGGYLSATLPFTCSMNEAESWIEYGLNRHVEIYNPGGKTVWAGFVNTIDAGFGTHSVKLGPVLDIVNRQLVIYTPIDYAASPPARGPQTETPIADDSTSQEKYGIIEGVYSASECEPETAYQIRDTTLADLSKEPRTETVSSEASNTVSITLGCRGYFDRLNHYVFNDPSTGQVSISTKIQSLLAADPNGLFSTDYSRIESNAFLVSAMEHENKMAWTILSGLLSIGTGTDERTFFGVYEDQLAVYFSTPTTVTYQHRTLEKNKRIEDYNSLAVIRPWDVLPGQWVFLPDYLVGRGEETTDLKNDPRNILIERVVFTAPYGVELNGQRFGTLPQLLAKMGLGGMA